MAGRDWNGMRTSIAATARRFLRWEFVPEAVLALGLTAFFLHQNDAATSAFKSSKAVAIMAAVTLGWLGARVLFARLVPFALARAAVFSVAAAVALSVVVFPAYDNETVIESFPTAALPRPACGTATARRRGHADADSARRAGGAHADPVRARHNPEEAGPGSDHFDHGRRLSLAGRQRHRYPARHHRPDAT